ncbi:MAG TPA: hypothetical protein VFN11_10265 [Ktedonobacterales bacterium]|jgi:hypothetical protein|nr:hypothetical protein [Ktedonobacterales bacterium]
MDSALKQYDYLDLLLPSVLFAVLAILVAAVGIARWRPVMVTTSLVGFALLMVGGILSHSPVAATASAALADSSVSSTQQIFAIAALRSGIVLGMLAAFYTLIVAARAHQWAWFVGIGLAAIIGAAAGVLVQSPSIWFDALGDQQAHAIASVPSYMLIGSVVAGLPLIVVLLDGLLGNPTPEVMRASNDVTLP